MDQRGFLEAETIEKRRKDKEEHSVAAYEGKFKQIQEISGESNLTELVEKFIEGDWPSLLCSNCADRFFAVEDKNFALFNYVNELNTQIEVYQEQLLDVQKDIHQFEQQGVDMEVQRKEKLDETEDKRVQVHLPNTLMHVRRAQFHSTDGLSSSLGMISVIPMIEKRKPK